MTLVLDGLLALALVGLALQVALDRVLFRGIVMFVVFGLVMALVWARLSAPDLAIAEAAIGAGMTGALLMVGYRRLLRAKGPPARPVRRGNRLAAPIALLTAGLVATLGTFALELPAGPGSAGERALAAMADLPVENPVTAVLLVFRGYDTLMELMVLLVALLGMRAVQGPAGAPELPAPAPAGQPLVAALLAALVPLGVLVAGYLLYAGGYAPGGAFQGGAVLAAVGVLLVLTARLRPASSLGWTERIGLVLGIAVFAGIGLAALGRGEAMLTLPGGWAIYAIETAMLLSIALTLVLLFAGGSGLRGGQRP
ncbi:hydrogenase subunit MbhD domain-containing protein [Coralloluteibacterium thermophilus]|uniref:Hydrogenase subunit MbhD domain-containing protein n=1 Tax=Coralloluteibacterium thermophilum TaxID=2707049 RepID=A0ABV9NK67_9GAMM